MIGSNSSLINGASGLVKVKLVYADGTAETLNYKVSTATSPIYFTTADHMKATTASASTTTIAAGDYYYTVTSAAGDTLYYVPSGTTGTDAAAGLVAGTAVSYVKNSDSTVSLGLKISKANAAGVAVGADVANTVTLKANDATSGITGKYVNAATKLVVIAADGTATTTTGYANFPTNGVTYTNTGAANTTACTKVFYQYTGTTLTDIVVIKAAIVNTSAVYGMFTGKYSSDANGVSDIFMVNGTATPYVMTSGSELTPYVSSSSVGDTGKLYEIIVTDGKAVAQEITAATLGSGAVGVVGTKGTANVTGAATEYFATASGVYYYTTTSQVNIVDQANVTMVSDTVAAGDAVTFVYKTVNGVNYVVAVFILSHA